MSRPLVIGLVATAVVLIAVGVALGAGAFGGSDDGGVEQASESGDLQTVSFQAPEDPGEDPFTEPADKKGSDTVELPKGQGPFGGTGSDLVCDRDLLIRSLKEDPEKLRVWARVAGVQPTYRAVSKYIAELHPVTLTRDTPVTNTRSSTGTPSGTRRSCRPAPRCWSTGTARRSCAAAAATRCSGPSR